MLRSLHISNYALIDEIDLDFSSGLNIITGETGGGKSIMLGALSLLLGGRADSRSVRQSDAKSVIEAEFDVSKNEAVRQLCAERDIEWAGDSMILRRELSPSGRSRTFVNDSPVKLDVMRDVGVLLVDVHSQHQNLLLSDSQFQLSIIDTLAGNATSLADYEELYNAYRSALHKLKATKVAIARDKENADFMQYQLQRIDELGLQPDEFENLENERERLEEAAEKRELFEEALRNLTEGDFNAVAQISEAIGALSGLAEVLPEWASFEMRLQSVLVELTDIADSLENASSAYPADASAELEAIDERIREINSVVSRQNVVSANELLEVSDKIRQKLDRLADSETIVSELEREARRAKKIAVDAAQKLSEARKKAAEHFSVTLHDAAVPLGMKNLVCDIAVEPADLSPTGMDKVEFRFAFNKNQTPLPVNVAASGGEISRLMLCIKFIIAHRMALPSIIFDEVDTGVSGDVADRMGRMMQGIASDLQVITITHLPQVAAKGESHFKVFKCDTDTSTVTHVERLSYAERIDEIAMMLSGRSDNEAARVTAKELLVKP